MYNLLIVDDEPIILSSLLEMVSSEREKQFVVYSASSASQALELFETVRIDLLMTDICMPGMDGIQLMKMVERRWSACRAIFLTGHSEFEYARQAVHPSIIAYVLKLEGDESILAALDKAYACLEESYQEQSRRLALASHLQETLPLVRRECLRKMIVTEQFTQADKDKLNKKLQLSGIALDIDSPMMMAVAIMDPSQDASTQGQIQSTVEETLKNPFCMVTALVFSHILLVVAQANREDTPARLKGFLEIAQNLCDHSGLTKPQIYVYDTAFSQTEMPHVFSVIYHRRFEMSDSIGVCLCGTTKKFSSFTWRDKMSVMNIFQMQGFTDCLANGDPGAWVLLMEQLMREICTPCPPVAITVFSSLSSTLLQAILNFLPNESDILKSLSLDRLANYFTHQSFADAMHFLDEVAELYFAERQAVCISTHERIVHKVNHYVLKNLSGDLSLPTLGSLVGLHPTYLSRIYRETSGLSVNQYIISQRLHVAQQYLTDPLLKINEIVERIGLTTASQFTHFFKKHVGITPQEYRNKVLAGGKIN